MRCHKGSERMEDEKGVGQWLLEREVSARPAISALTETVHYETCDIKMFAR